MKATRVHMCLDIRGWLMNHTRKRDYRGMFKHDDGRPMTADEAKANLLNQLAMGRKVLPFGDCDNFSFETGCLGHPTEPPRNAGSADAADNGRSANR